MARDSSVGGRLPIGAMTGAAVAVVATMFLISPTDLYPNAWVIRSAGAAGAVAGVLVARMLRRLSDRRRERRGPTTG